MNFFTQIPTVKYCEQAITGLIARPGYFVSNLPYILLGVWLLFKKDRISKIFGGFSIAIGLTSAFYDASFKYYAQIIDLNTMFAFLNFLFVFNLRKVWKLDLNKSIFLFVLIQAVYFALLIVLKGGVGSLLFGSLVVAYLISEFTLERISRKFWMIGFVLFLAGWILWQLDANQIWCDATNLFNGRALFHYFTTGTIFFIWKNQMVNKLRFSK